MRPSRTKTPLVLALLAACCAVASAWILFEWRAAIDWRLLAGAAALLVLASVVLRTLASRRRNASSDRSFERPSELSTLAFPPSSFRR